MIYFILMNGVNLCFSRNWFISPKLTNLCVEWFIMFPCYPFDVCRVCNIICVFSFFVSLTRGLPIFFLIFLKSQLFVSLIFFYCFSVFISLLSALIFIISFLLLALDLFCPSFARSLRWELGLLISDFSFSIITCN